MLELTLSVMYFSSTRGVLPYVSHTGMCRAFHKLLEIFQTVSRDFSRSCSKNNQKLLFVTKVAQKLLEKKKTSLWSGAKICKLYNKSKISKHSLCNFAA